MEPIDRSASNFPPPQSPDLNLEELQEEQIFAELRILFDLEATRQRLFRGELMTPEVASSRQPSGVFLMVAPEFEPVPSSDFQATSLLGFERQEQVMAPLQQSEEGAAVAVPSLGVERVQMMAEPEFVPTPLNQVGLSDLDEYLREEQESWTLGQLDANQSDERER